MLGLATLSMKVVEYGESSYLVGSDVPNGHGAIIGSTARSLRNRARENTSETSKEGEEGGGLHLRSRVED
jgi:hypothetical protein